MFQDNYGGIVLILIKVTNRNVNTNTNTNTNINVNTGFIPNVNLNTGGNSGIRNVYTITPTRPRVYRNYNYVPVYTYRPNTGISLGQLFNGIRQVITNLGSVKSWGTIGTVARQDNLKNIDLNNIAKHSNLGSLSNLGNLGFIGDLKTLGLGSNLGGSRVNVGSNLESGYNQGSYGSSIDVGSENPGSR